MILLATNFSHRIDHLSFGLPTPGLIQPLNGDLKLSNTSKRLPLLSEQPHLSMSSIRKGSQTFQYFLEVVPTVVQTSYANVETYQYAVTEKVRTFDRSSHPYRCSLQTRSINHESGSHGLPGIFIRYEISPLKISVKEVNRSYWLLLIEIAGIFGGVYATSGTLCCLRTSSRSRVSFVGMIHSLITVVTDALFKQCAKIPSAVDDKRQSVSDDGTSTVAIGITPESSAVM